MTPQETREMIFNAARRANAETSVAGWLRKEGLDRETFDEMMLLTSEALPEMIPSIVVVGIGFHLGWEARKQVDEQDMQRLIDEHELAPGDES